MKGSSYAIVEGIDGRTHHIKFTEIEMTGDATPGAIVEARTYDDAQGRKHLTLATRSDLSIEAQVTAQGASRFSAHRAHLDRIAVKLHAE